MGNIVCCNFSSLTRVVSQPLPGIDPKELSSTRPPRRQWCPPHWRIQEQQSSSHRALFSAWASSQQELTPFGRKARFCEFIFIRLLHHSDVISNTCSKLHLRILPKIICHTNSIERSSILSHNTSSKHLHTWNLDGVRINQFLYFWIRAINLENMSGRHRSHQNEMHVVLHAR